MSDFAKERLITVEDAAKCCHVSRRTVERWFKEGLEGVRFGRKVLTTREALIRFSQPVIPPSPAPLIESGTALDAQMRGMGMAV